MSLSRYQLSNKQVSTSLSGETVILQFDSGEYYNLNEVGSFIWELLQQKPHTLPELLTEVCQNFAVEASDCEIDIQHLLYDLVNEQLVSEIS